MNDRTRLEGEISPTQSGRRLDQALADLFRDYSRSRIQQWIRAGEVMLDGTVERSPRYQVQGGEQVEIETCLPREDPACRPQAIPLEIVHEDAAILVLDKPAGLVVHPAAGNPDGTLQNALLYYDPALAALPRAGIVHRLDKDTSGLLVVARTLPAHAALVRQLQERSVSREYLALVQGRMTAGGRLETPIGRHPVDRKRMAVLHHGGKEAITHYRVEQRFAAHTLLRVKLETGRTHQIRVHMAHLRHPIVGDPVYGGRMRLPAGVGEVLRQALQGFRRQALHATALSLQHPQSGELVSWQADMPEDMAGLVALLREDASCS